MATDVDRAVGLIGKTVKLAQGTIKPLEVQVRKSGIRLVGLDGDNSLIHAGFNEVVWDVEISRKEAVASLMAAVDGIREWLDPLGLTDEKYLKVRENLDAAYAAVKGTK